MKKLFKQDFLTKKVTNMKGKYGKNFQRQQKLEEMLKKKHFYDEIDDEIPDDDQINEYLARNEVIIVLKFDRKSQNYFSAWIKKGELLIMSYMGNNILQFKTIVRNSSNLIFV